MARGYCHLFNPTAAFVLDAHIPAAMLVSSPPTACCASGSIAGSKRVWVAFVLARSGCRRPSSAPAGCMQFFLDRPSSCAPSPARAPAAMPSLDTPKKALTRSPGPRGSLFRAKKKACGVGCSPRHIRNTYYEIKCVHVTAHGGGGSCDSRSKKNNSSRGATATSNRPRLGLEVGTRDLGALLGQRKGGQGGYG